jgi:hypothetical protein
MNALRLPRFLSRRHLSGRRAVAVANGCSQLRIVGDVQVVAPPAATVTPFERRARQARWVLDGAGRRVVSLAA